MDSHRFDAITRRLAAAASGSRRQTLTALAAGVLAAALTRLDEREAAAGCKKYKRKCKRKRSCCKHVGLRCRRRRCRCKRGWKRCASSGKGCTRVKRDPLNCGACGNACPPATPCCINGSCQPLCGDSCCADCFVDKLNGETPQPETETCCGPGSGTLCSSQKHQTSDDECCWTDQACVKGHCCSNGFQGAVICGGECCAAASCCNGSCCPTGLVCSAAGACVSASRGCVVPGDCLAGETCHGGVCCSGDRICGNPIDGEVCCPAGEYCDDANPATAKCCAINTTCDSTWRGHRVRR